MPCAQESANSKATDAAVERVWIKVRPNASVPIAEETTKMHEHFFPLTTKTYVAAPTAKESAARQETSPQPAGKSTETAPAENSKTVCRPAQSGSSSTPRATPAPPHRHACGLRGDPACRPRSAHSPRPTRWACLCAVQTKAQKRKSTEMITERPLITTIERAKTSHARCQECKEYIGEFSLRFGSEGQVFSKKFRHTDCVWLSPAELSTIVGWNSLGDPDEVDDIISGVLDAHDAQQVLFGAGPLDTPARKAKLVFEDVD